MKASLDHRSFCFAKERRPRERRASGAGPPASGTKEKRGRAKFWRRSEARGKRERGGEKFSDQRKEKATASTSSQKEGRKGLTRVQPYPAPRRGKKGRALPDGMNQESNPQTSRTERKIPTRTARKNLKPLQRKKKKRKGQSEKKDQSVSGAVTEKKPTNSIAKRKRKQKREPINFFPLGKKGGLKKNFPS